MEDRSVSGPTGNNRTSAVGRRSPALRHFKLLATMALLVATVAFIWWSQAGITAEHQNAYLQRLINDSDEVHVNLHYSVFAFGDKRVGTGIADSPELRQALSTSLCIKEPFRPLDRYYRTFGESVRFDAVRYIEIEFRTLRELDNAHEKITKIRINSSPGFQDCNAALIDFDCFTTTYGRVSDIRSSDFHRVLEKYGR